MVKCSMYSVFTFSLRSWRMLSISNRLLPRPLCASPITKPLVFWYRVLKTVLDEAFAGISGICGRGGVCTVAMNASASAAN
ncbi:hypothetical protein D3C79_779650 [compost metagenome]